MELLIEVGSAAEEKEVSRLSGVMVRFELFNLKLITSILGGEVFISVNEQFLLLISRIQLIEHLFITRQPIICFISSECSFSTTDEGIVVGVLVGVQGNDSQYSRENNYQNQNRVKPFDIIFSTKPIKRKSSNYEYRRQQESEMPETVILRRGGKDDITEWN